MQNISQNGNLPMLAHNPGGTPSAQMLPASSGPLAALHTKIANKPIYNLNGQSGWPKNFGLPESSTTPQFGRSPNGDMDDTLLTFLLYACRMAPSPLITTPWPWPLVPDSSYNLSQASIRHNQMTQRPYQKETSTLLQQLSLGNIFDPPLPLRHQALHKSHGPSSNGSGILLGHM